MKHALLHLIITTPLVQLFHETGMQMGSLQQWRLEKVVVLQVACVNLMFRFYVAHLGTNNVFMKLGCIPYGEC